jgi:hypothetical protein
MSEHKTHSDDQLVKDERVAFTRMCDEHGTTSSAREEVKRLRRERYSQFIKSVKTIDVVQKLTWEDQLDKLGFKVIRNETVFDGEGFTFYKGEYKNKLCLCKVYTSKDYQKRFNITNQERVAGILAALNYPRVQKLIAVFEITQQNKMYYFGDFIQNTLQGKSLSVLLLRTRTA